MRFLIKLIIPFILLVTALNAPSQTNDSKYKLMYETARDELYLTYLRLDSARSVLSVDSKLIENIRNENKLKDSVIENLKLIAKNSELETGLLKSELSKKHESIFLEFRGFYAGLSAYYRFEDTILTKQTVLGGMKYDLIGTVKFTLSGVLDIETGLAIPLRNEKFAVIFKADWKIL